jgi:hypothetical protein
VGCDVTHLREGDKVAVDPNRYMNDTAASTGVINNNGRQEICPMKFCYEASHQFYIVCGHVVLFSWSPSKNTVHFLCVYTHITRLGSVIYIR